MLTTESEDDRGRHWCAAATLAIVAVSTVVLAWLSCNWWNPALRDPPFTLAGKSIYFVFVDRFAHDADDHPPDCYGPASWCGGNLRGLIRRLDYIADMGFDCVWITPVVDQPADVHCSPVEGQEEDYCGVGYHGYWAQDLYAIDRRFGSPSDLLALSFSLKSRGMGLVLDVVLNHVRPLNTMRDLMRVQPFDRPEFYHTYGAPPNESFASYLRHPTGCWPPPGCSLAAYDCGDYDEQKILNGWFYDLGDLNQTHPFVSQELQRWGAHMVRTYRLDAIRLDTAPYMPRDFLKDFRRAAGVEIYGEVTASNESFLESFLADPADGRPSVDGLFDFRMFGSSSGEFRSVPVSPLAPRSRERRLCASSASASSQHGDLTQLAAAIEAKLAWAARVPSDAFANTFANFLDTHDEERIMRRCGFDRLKVLSALATLFLLQGVPGYAHEDNRHALWASRFNQSSELYQHIRALNRVRRQQRLGLATMTLIGASDEWVVLCRGDPATAAGSAWLFANNHPASREHTPHVYCPPRLPPRLPPEGDGEWVDELSGQRARFVDGCLHAPDGRPKVLVSRMFSRQPMAASDERTRSAEHATQIISD